MGKPVHPPLNTSNILVVHCFHPHTLGNIPANHTVMPFRLFLVTGRVGASIIHASPAGLFKLGKVCEFGSVIGGDGLKQDIPPVPVLLLEAGEGSHHTARGFIFYPPDKEHASLPLTQGKKRRIVACLVS